METRNVRIQGRIKTRLRCLINFWSHRCRWNCRSFKSCPLYYNLWLFGHKLKELYKYFKILQMGSITSRNNIWSSIWTLKVRIELANDNHTRMNVDTNCSNVWQRIQKKRMRLRTGNQGKCGNVLFFCWKINKDWYSLLNFNKLHFIRNSDL